MRLAAFVTLAFLLLPVTASSQVDVGQIAFGGRHAIALRTNGDVVTWGNNVMCQLGRRGGNQSGDPGLVLRNGVHVAAAADHSIAVTRDGHVYGWGMNAEGQLGVGNEFDQCQGPALIESLEGKRIVQVATGQNFSVALGETGELYCAGASDMGQCPAVKGVPNEVFRAVAVPPGMAFDAISAGSFHTLARTRDGRLYAFGRGRDGQLGNGRTTNGAGIVDALSNVVSFDAGTWHSAAVTADGAAWVWGNNGKSQLCDGTTTNRSVPARASIEGAAKVLRVAAGGHGTLIQSADGAIFACGDNQFGGLGAATPVVVATPARVMTPAVTSGVFVAGGNYAAVSVDGCAVRLTGDSGEGVVNPKGDGSRTFVPRPSLSLCGTRATTTMADVVNPAPRGGVSGCWAPPVNEDAAASPRFGGLNAAMVAAEDILTKNPAFVAPLEPVRWRSSRSAGPLEDAGARLHVSVVPERKIDGTRLWTTGCGVIPQLDRIGGAISQISVFLNVDPRGYLIGSAGAVPKQTGRAGGFPEYDNWVLITKDGRLPWIPVTLGEKLDDEGEKRERALAEWKSRAAGMKMPDESATQKTYEMLKRSDPAGGDKFLTSARQQRDELARLQRDVYPLQTASLERQLQEYRQYRALQSPEALRSPAVRGDVSGEGKRKLDAEVARLRAIPDSEQQQINALTKQGRAQEARAIRQAHTERSAPLIADAIARYDLTNLQAGPAERAIGVKPDPAFPDFKEPNRIQLIAVSFSMDPNPRNTERRAWQQRVKDTFDYTALAALLK